MQVDWKALYLHLNTGIANKKCTSAMTKPKMVSDTKKASESRSTPCKSSATSADTAPTADSAGTEMEPSSALAAMGAATAKA